MIKSLPRMRGDRPYAQQLREEKALFTPHARGSTYIGGCIYCNTCVYPACAGIDPKRSCLFRKLWSLPRMRGDRP